MWVFMQTSQPPPNTLLIIQLENPMKNYKTFQKLKCAIKSPIQRSLDCIHYALVLLTFVDDLNTTSIMTKIT